MDFSSRQTMPRHSWYICLCLLLATSFPVFSQEKKNENKDVKNLFKKKLTLGVDNYIQQSSSDRFDLKDNYKAFSLNDAIEQGLRKNFNQRSRNYENKILELGWKDTKEDFWMPKLQISLSSGEQRIARLKRGSRTGNGTSLTPSGTLGLEIGEYTLFNWGKDYLAYQNDRASYKRESEVLKESRRELKHDLILKYFALVKFHNILKVKKDQLRHASFVYRFNREKMTLRKISRQDYYQSRMEYLRAQTEYHDAKNDASVVDEQMAYLVSDEPGTRYILTNELSYEKLKTTMGEALNLSKERNPEIRTNAKDVANAKRSHDIVLRENLALPKFTVNLGAYTHSFGKNESRTVYETRTNDSNIDIVATVNATWTLTGSGGFFNGRKTTSSLISRHLSFNKLAQAKHMTKSDIRNHFNNIKYLENQHTILDARTSNLQKTFDVILENYINKKTRFLDFHDALTEMTDAEVLMENVKYLHLEQKVMLAKEVGIDEFPGESFESVAIDKQEAK